MVSQGHGREAASQVSKQNAHVATPWRASAGAASICTAANGRGPGAFNGVAGSAATHAGNGSAHAASTPAEVS